MLSNVRHSLFLAHKSSPCAKQRDTDDWIQHAFKYKQNVFFSSTGTVSVDLEWDLIPDKKDVNLSGFKVLVNGKQHGFLLHSNIDRICLQVNHKSMASLFRRIDC